MEKNSKNTVVLLTGSNLGNSKELLNQAKIALCKQIGTLAAESKVIESEPWGFEHPNLFLNQVLIFHTPLSPQDCLTICLQIENELGRKRSGKGYEARTMDIDILYYNREIIEEENLIIPHPRLHERAFTLVPLNEVIPDFVHPVLKMTAKEMLERIK